MLSAPDLKKLLDAPAAKANANVRALEILIRNRSLTPELVRIFDETVDVDDWGLNPLHAFLDDPEKNTKHKIEGIRFFAQVHPEALLQPDSESGQVPFARFDIQDEVKSLAAELKRNNDKDHATAMCVVLLQACASSHKGELVGVCECLIGKDYKLVDLSSEKMPTVETARSIGEGSSDQKLRQYFKQVGTFLDRYKVKAGEPVHQSQGCWVQFAKDQKAAKGEPAKVALKRMWVAETYRNERRARDQGAFDPNRVMRVLRSHDSDDTEGDLRDEQGHQVFCLVMPRADRSLHQAVQSERFAGHDITRVTMIMRDVALALKAMHDKGWVHADLKPRNVVRVGERWLLIDLDAAVQIGSRLGAKRSTGYCAPELMALGKDGGGQWRLLDDAQPSYDVWSFGVVLYLLCTGSDLFKLDANDDNLDSEEEVQRLVRWQGVGDGGDPKAWKHGLRKVRRWSVVSLLPLAWPAPARVGRALAPIVVGVRSVLRSWRIVGPGVRRGSRVGGGRAGECAGSHRVVPRERPQGPAAIHDAGTWTAGRREFGPTHVPLLLRTPCGEPSFAARVFACS